MTPNGSSGTPYQQGFCEVANTQGLFVVNTNCLGPDLNDPAMRRRFLVLGGGEARDEAYFTALKHELDNGGVEEFLHFLLVR